MSERALKKLLDLTADDRRELQYHKSVLQNEINRLETAQNDIRDSVLAAAKQVDVRGHEQFQAYEQFSRGRVYHMGMQQQKLEQTSQAVTDEVLKLHQRERSYKLLLERAAKRKKKQAAKREMRDVEMYALRRWLEDRE